MGEVFDLLLILCFAACSVIMWALGEHQWAFNAALFALVIDTRREVIKRMDRSEVRNEP